MTDSAPLHRLIARHIAATGPMPVSRSWRGRRTARWDKSIPVWLKRYGQRWKPMCPRLNKDVRKECDP